jgi:hypothetical protein
MTLARIVRRKAAHLARRSWAGGEPARLVDFNPSSKATAKQWLDPFFRTSTHPQCLPTHRSPPTAAPESTILTMPSAANSP